jgi:hypothetical protein
MNISEHLKERIDHLITLVNKTIASTYSIGGSISYVESELFKEFETSSLSFILNLYGKDHPYYITFKESCSRECPRDAEKGRGILSSIKTEIDKGWLIELRTIVSAEIFSDFLEMSKYFLDEGYKDPAAVMIGSILEENLRKIAIKNSIDTTFTNASGDIKPKKADTLNADIVKAGVYNMLDQKQITAWLDLRNKAAHGEYGKYDNAQVSLMYQGVLNFIATHNN